MNLDKSFNDFVEVIKLSFKGFFFDDKAIQKAKKLANLNQIIVYYLLLTLFSVLLPIHTLLSHFKVSMFFPIFVMFSTTIFLSFLFIIILSLFLKIITSFDIFKTSKALLFSISPPIFLFSIFNFLLTLFGYRFSIIFYLLSFIFLVLFFLFVTKTLSIFHETNYTKTTLIFYLSLFVFSILMYLVNLFTYLFKLKSLGIPGGLI